MLAPGASHSHGQSARITALVVRAEHTLWVGHGFEQIAGHVVIVRAGAALDKDLGDGISIPSGEMRCRLVAEMATN